MDSDIEQDLKSYEISVDKEDNAMLLKQIDINHASVVICSTNELQTHYLPCVQDGNIILNPITDQTFTDDESIILKSTSEVTKCIAFDQIPDEDNAIPIISDDEEPDTNASKTGYTKRILYKTPFKPSKHTLRYMRKPVAHYDREEMLKTFAKRKQTNPNLTLLDCCVMLPKCVILDPKIFIPPLEFKAQLFQTDDTIQTISFMPGSKREMNRIRTGSVKLFANPAHQFTNSNLLKLYQANCVSIKQPNYETTTLDLAALWPTLPDVIPKTKFGYAYDKKVDTNDHVYSKTSDCLLNHRNNNLNPDEIDLNAVEIDRNSSNFDENSDGASLITDDSILIEEQLDTGRVITIGSYDSDEILIESSSDDDQIEIETIAHFVNDGKNDHGEILGIQSDVLFT